jgi:hypothetical protein
MLDLDSTEAVPTANFTFPTEEVIECVTEEVIAFFRFLRLPCGAVGELLVAVTE